MKGAKVSYRILVVDDEKEVRDFLSRALPQAGKFDVATAGGADDALRIVARDRIDLILTDVRMLKGGAFICLLRS
jgi:two-component system, NtrC family, response regulator GlrR